MRSRGLVPRGSLRGLEGFVVVAINAVIMALRWLVVQQARMADLRAKHRNNLKRFAQALHKSHGSRRTFFQDHTFRRSRADCSVKTFSVAE